MSNVTDILLLTALEEEGVEKVQDWLAKHNWPNMVEVSGHAGGNKVMQCEVWATAINYFDLHPFVLEILATEWSYPESVQLLVKGEHDESFAMRVEPLEEQQ